MTSTLASDRSAYKWARSREAQILQELAYWRWTLQRGLAPLQTRVTVFYIIARLRVLLQQWRRLIESLECDEHLGLP